MTVLDPLTIAAPDRLTSDLNQLATIVDTSLAGWTRQALTDPDVEGRRWVLRQMTEAGLDAHIDGAGNVIGVLRGTGPGNSAIMTGSHTDTVAGGGRFDGNVGVAAALEVVRTFLERGIRPRHDIIVVDFFSEEPNRFGISCVGSRAMTGHIGPVDLNRMDGEGARFADELKNVGIDPSALLSSRIDTSRIKAFVELHIEQGPYLEDQGSNIGLVTSITGIKRFRVAFNGRADHAGTTPMDRRMDAGCAAAGSVLAIERIASANAHGRGTTGTVTFTPQAVNIVTEAAELWGEFRSPDLEWLETASEQFHASARQEGESRAVDVQLEWLPSERPAGMDTTLLEIASRETDRLGLVQSRLYSGAEHDAAIIAKEIPTAMIFVPSKDGRSHCADEFTSEQDIHTGANVLLNTIIALDCELPFD